MAPGSPSGTTTGDRDAAPSAATPPAAPERVRRASRRPLLVAALLFGAGLVGAWQTHRVIAAHQHSRFDYESRRIESAVQERMTAYVQVMRGSLGLVHTAEHVSLEQWLAYVETLQLGQRYPGFKSLSYAQAVLPQDLPAFLERVRAQPIPPGMTQPALLREFGLRGPTGSDGATPVHSPIVFVAPMIAENERVLGVDMMQEPIRRAAMQRSASEGDVILSPRLNLSGQGDQRAGFIAYLAVKDGANLRGWLTSAFRADDFMHGLIGAGPAVLEFEVYDGEEPAPTALLYSTAGAGDDGAPRPLDPADAGRLERLGLIELPGRAWTLRYRAVPGFVARTDRLAPWLVALGGLLLSALFYTLVRSSERLHAAHGQLALRNRRLQAEVRERERAEAQVRHQATHDPLTGLANRALFLDRLQTAFERSRRRGRPFALAYIDVDGFKDVNDTWGHSVGDDLLKAIGQRIQQRLRREDTLARLGGDEFAVVFEDVPDPPVAVQGACADIVASLREPFALPGGASAPERVVRVGASVGLALHPRHGADRDALIAAADAAMYAAKRGGKSRCVLAEEPAAQQ